MIGTIKRGDIFLADLSHATRKDVETRTQQGIRPVVVTSNDLNNKYSPVVTVVPVTSQIKNNLPTHVLISKSSGLKSDSIAFAEGMRDLDKTALIKRLGAVSAEEMRQIELAIQIQNGITDPFDISYVHKLIQLIYATITDIGQQDSTGLTDTLMGELRGYCKRYGIDYNKILNRKMPYNHNYKGVRTGAL